MKAVFVAVLRGRDGRRFVLVSSHGDKDVFLALSRCPVSPAVRK
jgi:hypothetical protein